MTRVVYIICIIVFSFLASWIATFFGAGYFSGWGILANTIGAFLGVYIGFKINAYFLDS